MLILTICILCNVYLGVCFTLFSRYKIDNHSAIIVNYLVCVSLAALILRGSPIPLDITEVRWIPYAVFLGLIFIFGFNVLALSFQKFGIAFTTIIQKMSLVIPAFFAIIFYGESLGIYKLLGLLFAMVAIVLVNKEKGQMLFGKAFFENNKFIIFPILTFLLSGVIESLLFYCEAEQIVLGGDVQFVSSSFAVAGFLGIIYILFSKEHSISWPELVGGIALGIPNFFTIYLLVYLLDKGWEGSVLFPLNNIGILLLSALVGIGIFKEKLNNYKAIGLVLSVISIILIAIS